MTIPEPKLIGYFARPTTKRTNWPHAEAIEEICNASTCMSARDWDWINEWHHNEMWAFDSPELALAVVPVELRTGCDLYAYRLFRVRFVESRREPFAIPDVWPADERWLDVSMVYSYFRGFNKAWNKNRPDIYEVNHAEFAKIPVRPVFLGESTDVGEHEAWGSALQARKQAYWCVLSGGFGHAYGSPNWNFPANWREVLELPGANSLKHLRALLEVRPWWKLMPDVNNVVAVDGRGTFATNDYAITALANDGSFALSYLPSKRALTIDLTKLSGERIVASWFNPRTGETARIGEFTDKKRHAFEPPGDGDWVLVLQAE